MLVCVGPSPHSATLIRSTAHLAAGLNAPWVALHIEHSTITASQRQRATTHLELAGTLGAETRTVSGRFDADTILQFAVNEGVTQLVLGKPEAGRWSWWRGPSLVDELVSRSEGLDLGVVGSHGDTGSPRRNVPKPGLGGGRGYLLATLAVSATTGLSYPFVSEESNELMVYLAAVVFVSYYLGRGPAILASVLSVILFNFFFVPPILTFKVADPRYLLTFLVLFLVGWLVSSLTARARNTAKAALYREQQAVTLFSLNRDLTRAGDEGEVLKVLRDQTERMFGNPIVLQAENGGLARGKVRDEDWEAAQAAFQTGKPVGKGSDRTWLPLLGSRTCHGVVGLTPPEGHTRDDRDLLDAMLSQTSAALDRIELGRRAMERDVLEATEKLHKALLNSVSHDLRIPLVTINGTLSSLLDADLRLDPDTEKEMVQSALSEAERLTRLVSNLLQMSKMEAGSLKLNIVPCDPWDLISTTVAGLQSRLKRRTISLHGEEDQPLVPVDYVLIQQVLINLLENSLQHGQGAIRVGLESRPESLLFWVEDEGEPISPELEGRLFERFSRGRELADGGSGLGLSICKGLVEAHRGKIWLEGGRRFCFSLPLEDEDE